MAVDVISKTLYDPFDGRRDLKESSGSHWRHLLQEVMPRRGCSAP